MSMEERDINLRITAENLAGGVLDSLAKQLSDLRNAAVGAAAGTGTLNSGLDEEARKAAEATTATAALTASQTGLAASSTASAAGLALTAGAMLSLALFITPTAALIGAVATALIGLTASIGGLAAVAGGIILVMHSVNQLLDTIGKAPQGFENALGLIKQSLADAGYSIQQSVAQAGGGLQTLTGYVLLWIHQAVPLFQSFMSSLSNGAGNALAQITLFVQRWINFFTGAFSGGGISNAINGFFHVLNSLTPAAEALFRGLGQFIGTFVQVSSNLIGPLSNVVSGFITNFFDALSKLLQIYAPLSSATESLSVAILDLADHALGALIPIAQALVPIVQILITGLDALAHAASFAAPVWVPVAVALGILAVNVRLLGPLIYGLGQFIATLGEKMLVLGAETPVVGFAIESLGADTVAAGAGLAAMVNPILLVVTAVAVLGLGISMLAAHFRHLAEARGALQLTGTLIPELNAGRISIDQFAASLGHFQAVGAVLAASPVPSGMAQSMVGANKEVIGLTLSSQEFSQVWKDQLIPALVAGQLTWQQIYPILAQNHVSVTQARYDVAQYANELKIQAQAIQQYAQAVGSSINPMMAQVKAGLGTFLSASNQTWAQFVAGAQQATAQGTKGWLTFIQQQDAALLTVRANVATALGSTGSFFQQFANQAHVSFDKVVKDAQAWVHQQQQVFADWETILKKGGDAAKPMVASLAQMGIAGAGLAHAIASQSAPEVKKLADILGTGNQQAQNFAGTITTQVLGTLQALNGFLLILAHSMGVTLPTAIVQSLLKMSNLTGDMYDLATQTNSAMGSVNALAGALQSLPAHIPLGSISSQGLPHKQAGGFIPGYGGGDIAGPFMLEPGELVVPKERAAVAAAAVGMQSGGAVAAGGGPLISVQVVIPGPVGRDAAADIVRTLAPHMERELKRRGWIQPGVPH